jgi:transcriptional regulator with XRE-family HTH domain
MRTERFMKQVRALRKALGWSQVYLAEKVGLTQATVSLFEAGDRRPAFETLIALASAFDVSLDVLVFGTEINSKEAPDHER